MSQTYNQKRNCLINIFLWEQAQSFPKSLSISNHRVITREETASLAYPYGRSHFPRAFANHGAVCDMTLCHFDVTLTLKGQSRQVIAQESADLHMDHLLDDVIIAKLLS